MLFQSTRPANRSIVSAAIACFAIAIALAIVFAAIGPVLPLAAHAAAPDDAPKQAATKQVAGETAEKAAKSEKAVKAKTAGTEKAATSAKQPKPKAKRVELDGAKAPTTGPLANPEQANEKAPAVFRVAFETTKGPIVVEVQRAWAPNGADRFYNLVKIGFYEDIAFFRVIDGFMAQFGIHGTPAINRAWQRAVIKDDPVVESNLRGTLTFAKTNRPNSRTSQVFINFSDNVNLDRMGFAPFARVVEGMDVVDQIYKVGEGKPRGKGPSQRRIQSAGNAFLKKAHPELDYIRGARVLD